MVRSSTVKVFVFTKVVFPLTVKSPAIVRSLLAVIAPTKVDTPDTFRSPPIEAPAPTVRFLAIPTPPDI